MLRGSCVGPAWVLRGSCVVSAASCGEEEWRGGEGVERVVREWEARMWRLLRCCVTSSCAACCVVRDDAHCACVAREQQQGTPFPFFSSPLLPSSLLCSSVFLFLL